MAEIKLELQVPSDLMDLGLDQDELQRRVVEWLVLSLFTEGRISSGKAARLLHLTRVAFLAILHKRGIAYINYTPDELAAEVGASRLLPPPVGR